MGIILHHNKIRYFRGNKFIGENLGLFRTPRDFEVARGQYNFVLAMRAIFVHGRDEERGLPWGYCDSCQETVLSPCVLHGVFGKICR
ncbi:hypothetical protein ATCV1_z560R [Acanthocystis turfacea chlorella virus 1]|uniref:Uncharacterized protein z560R n=1 Tax=Chlorovirus heliozoae TaxID=322019 RepID=A7K9H0_9PHYC|nr:hypothetical protein ATCV1_z560R [Acanthocystis turfacea chlorella virus 1]ABT16694.1 hypothetical protein ATCV1_z560R [Acanthocystis turfacea chlorella virus 1]